MHGRREFRGRSAAARIPAADPRPLHMRYFAEGASNDFFATRLAVMNPNDDAATVLVRLYGANGRRRPSRAWCRHARERPSS